MPGFWRPLFPHSGYRFLAEEDLVQESGREYAKLSLVDDETDGRRKFLFSYLAEESIRTHVLSRENVEAVLASCEAVLAASEGQSKKLEDK